MSVTPVAKSKSRDNLVESTAKNVENRKSIQAPRHKHVHSAHSHYVTTKKKLTTRHFAALDFLLMIPMRNEHTIKETGKNNANRNERMIQDENDDEGKLNHDYYNSQVVAQQQTMSGGDNNAVGRKLKGHNAIVIKTKHRKHSELSADVRQWEDHLLNGNYDILLQNYSSIKLSSNDSKQALPLLSTRMFYSRQRSYPVCLFSVIKYDEKREEAKIEKLKAGDQRGLEVFYAPKRDWRGNHYQKLIKSMEQDDGVDAFLLHEGYMYDPNYLDDPDLFVGANRHLLHSSIVTGPIISSVLLYIDEQKLKETLNEKFREKHANTIPPSLTLSKVRNVKKAALVMAQQLGIEVATVAIAVICFERLCIQGIITKYNRYLTMAVCMLLAYKFNEASEVSKQSSDEVRNRLTRMFQYIDHEWEVSRQDIYDAEFGAYVKLEFTLHVPCQHAFLVYTRLLKLINKSSRSYLGDEMSEFYTSVIAQLERDRLENPLQDPNVEGRGEEHEGENEAEEPAS